jgi:hypothetical protein
MRAPEIPLALFISIGHKRNNVVLPWDIEGVASQATAVDDQPRQRQKANCHANSTISRFVSTAGYQSFWIFSHCFAKKKKKKKCFNQSSVRIIGPSVIVCAMDNFAFDLNPNVLSGRCHQGVAGRRRHPLTTLPREQQLEVIAGETVRRQGSRTPPSRRHHVVARGGVVTEPAVCLL